jgi:Sec-independent protein translocase protein TatA
VVDLFGKKKLEDRVLELESSLKELKSDNEERARTLEKRDEKIRKLTAANQECNQALKAAEQRAAAASTSSALDASDLDEGAKRCTKPQAKGSKTSPRELGRLVKRLKECRSGEDDLLTAYLSDSKDLVPEAQEVAQVARSERGWIVLKYPQLFTMLFVPPFPVRESVSAPGEVFSLAPLQEMMETPVLVVSAHAGDTFLGVAFGPGGFEVQEFVQSQVKEKHSKGGWSQKRFERLREEDIKNHIDEVLLKLAGLDAKYGSVAKYAVLGGDQSLLKQITPATALPIVERRLDRHDEKRLDKLLDEVYGFTIYRI